MASWRSFFTSVVMIADSCFIWHLELSLNQCSVVVFGSGLIGLTADTLAANVGRLYMLKCSVSPDPDVLLCNVSPASRVFLSFPARFSDSYQVKLKPD